LKTSEADMSSQNLDNGSQTSPVPGPVAGAVSWSPRSAAERVLMALKMHGALSAAALGPMLGTTGEAVRQQLARLAQDGLVVATSQPRGVGRPAQLWALTEAAQSRFPDTHAALTVQLLDIIRSSMGQDAIDRLIAIRESQTRTGYEAALVDSTCLRDRVAALADLRSAEGYMAEWREEPDGSLLLIENHCPICAAATACQNFCRAELDVFRAVLGPEVTV